jgi:hypothetical protein
MKLVASKPSSVTIPGAIGERLGNVSPDNLRAFV